MHMYGIQKSSIDEPVYEEEMETQMQRMDWWTQQGKERQTEEVILTYTYHVKNR